MLGCSVPAFSHVYPQIEVVALMLSMSLELKWIQSTYYKVCLNLLA